VAGPAAAPAAVVKPETRPRMTQTSLFEFSVPALTAEPDAPAKPLADHKGKVALVVNVASECGYTPQYGGLQALYQELAIDGQLPFTILAFPSNDFGEQEPGGPDEINKTCTKYKVTFPLYGKISVTGDSADPLYRWIIQQPASGNEPPKWNFTKFVVDHNGKVVARFDTRISPDDPTLRRTLNELLAAAPKTSAPTSTNPDSKAPVDPK